MAGILQVVPRAGLCNRLRAVLCGIGVAEATNRKLVVSWRPGIVFDALMNDLWLLHPAEGYPEPSEDIEIIETGAVFGEDIQPRPWIDNYWPNFTLTQELRARVNWTIPPLHGAGYPVIGLAVRAHQHAHDKTKFYSPPEWYEFRLDQILADFPDAAVFVSCDVPELVEQWRQDWPQIVTLPDKGEYGSVRGCQDALCDLHILAGCDYLLGAHWSSLSSTAALLQGTGAYETSLTASKVSLKELMA